jgi:hypothetical protein
VSLPLQIYLPNGMIRQPEPEPWSSYTFEVGVGTIREIRIRKGSRAMTIDFINKMILIQTQSSPLKTSCGAEDCPAERLDAAQSSGGAAEHC